MVQYNVVVVYAFSIHFNRFYRAILVENSEISNDYKTDKGNNNSYLAQACQLFFPLGLQY